MISHLRRDAIRFILISTVFAVYFFIFPGRICADESSVTIDAPATATRGEEITIKVTALHDGNNFFHYTDWLYIMINDKEVARWDYTWRKRPEGKTFTKEITYMVTDPVEIKAEAHCNLHGSTGPKTLKISVNKL